LLYIVGSRKHKEILVSEGSLEEHNDGDNQSINQYKIAYTKSWSALHTKYRVYKTANKTE